MSPPPPAAVPIAAWIGTWSRPSDAPGRLALGLAVVLLAIAVVPRGRHVILTLIDPSSVTDLNRRRPFLIVASLAAAFLSLGYIAVYLRGGSRAPDAATYWLEGRALSHGVFTWAISDPTASFRANGLVFHPPDRLTGAFAPGYPLLLGMGFLVGAPMLVGPLLAAGLIVMTWLLAHEMLAEVAMERTRIEAIARLAAGLSILSAALRYHTADVLPYGAAAVAMSTSIACALRARRVNDSRLFVAAGLAVGFLVAATPASALAVGAVVAVIAAGSSRPARAIVMTCFAALPGVLLLLAHNHAVTGNALVVPAVESGAMVSGSTASAPVQSALRVAGGHLLDVANFEPLALLAVVPVLGKKIPRAFLLAGLTVAAQMFVLAVVGGDSPAVGQGAGRLICIAPLEQVLVALGVARLFPRAFTSAAVATLGLSLGGFALHASHVHESLAAHDIGRPRFEPDIVREANVTHGLLFFDDDTGYELASEPGVSASHGIESVRLRGDDHDRLLYDLLGHPAVHQYVAAGASASVAIWAPPNAGGTMWRFEAESDWPPVVQTGGFTEVQAGDPCASGGRVLRLTPSTKTAQASVTIELPVPRAPDAPDKRMWMVTPRVSQNGEGKGSAALVTDMGTTLAEWTWGGVPPSHTCVDLTPKALELGGDRMRVWLVIGGVGGAVSYDKTTLSPL